MYAVVHDVIFYYAVYAYGVSANKLAEVFAD